MAAKRVIFEGRVQGVGFRYTTKDVARGFDVRGWVKNLPDGTVELQVDGDAEEVAAFLKELAEESVVSHHIRAMHVEAIAPLDQINGFTIER
jgi:acylphosphatase